MTDYQVASFNSTMVRLKEEIYSGVRRPKHGFNSTMVRLKA